MANTTSALGLTESTVVVGDDGVVTGQAGTSANRNVTDSTATNVGTGAGDTSDAEAENTAQVGIYSSPITIGDEGTVNGYEYASVTADASSIEGASTASAVFSGLTGTGTGAVSSTGAIIDQTTDLITEGAGSSAGTPLTEGVRTYTFSYTGPDTTLTAGDEVSVGLGGLIYQADVTGTISGADALIAAIASTVNAAGSGTGVPGSGTDLGFGLTPFFATATNGSPFALLQANGGDLTVVAGTGTQSNALIVSDNNSNPTTGSIGVTDNDGTSAGTGTDGTMSQNFADALVTSYVAAVGSSSGTPAVYGPGNADDIVIGDNGLINAFADNIADADATSVSANADATATIRETYGMLNIDVEVGDDGDLNASAVVDVFADATTVGDPAGGTGTAKATADATATTVVGVQDVGSGNGDFTFGNDAEITASAGTLADQVQVVANATSTTGAADASAVLSDLAGIRDDLSSAAGTGTSIVPDTSSLANVIEVGDNGVIDTDAFARVSASANTVEGLADADSTTTDVDAIAVDQVVIGNDGALSANAGIVTDATAVTVDGQALANTDLTGIGGLTSEQVTVGDNATLLGGYGINARVDADLTTTATSTGTDTADSALADGQLGLATGIQLGDGDGSAETTLTIGNNGSVAGVADVTNAATATSVDGNTEAVAKVGADDATLTGDSAIGIDLNDAMEVGQDATVLAQAMVDLDATATTQAGVGNGSGSAIAGAGAELVAGLDLDMADGDVSSIGADGTITALGQVTADASATSVEAFAGAAAGDLNPGFSGLGSGNGSSEMTVVGLQTNASLAIGDGGSIDADASSTLKATASSVTLDGNAYATMTNNVGLDVDGTGSAALTVGANGTLNGEANNASTANANSIDASAIALADVETNIGVDLEGDLSVGSTGSLTGTADLDLTAAAVTVGDNGTADAATATAGNGSAVNTGLALDGSGLGVGSGIDVSIGANGTVVGDADADLSASATGVAAGVTASSLLNEAIAIDLQSGGSGAGSATLQIGDAGTITANSRVGSTATASTTDGTASATSDTNSIAGLGDGSGSVYFGSSGVVDADAVGVGAATASSVDAGSAGSVTATVDQDLVQAIDLSGGGTVVSTLLSGSTLSVDADASSTQTATASVIGTPGIAADGSATASVGSGDQVYGIDTTTVTVGSDATLMTVNATLVGTATATNMGGASTATAGDTADVVALNVGGSGSGSLVVGDSATNGMSFAAVSNLTANASSIEDDATAQVGMDNGHDTGTGTMVSSLGSAGSVTGVDTSDITVGENAGTILASASSTLSATAATTGTNGFDSTDLPIVAEAVLGQTSDGLKDSSVTIGADGNVSGRSTLVGTATATNVGDGTGDDAYSTINLSGDGINTTENGTGTITIGATGNVSGQSLLNADASSTTVSGTAEAKSLLDSTGVNLDVADADITIGESGNISGLGVIGELSGGVFSDQVDVLATAKLEDATALGKLTVAGISGDDDGVNATPGANQTLLTAGPNGGNVTGQALGGANLVATTVGDPTATTNSGDDATATLETSTLSGLADVDILGGMVGTNTIKGTSFGDFDVTADSIKGNATGSSDVDAYGIIDNDDDGNITLSGNIEAIAQLTNTVTARTIEGNASSDVSADALGMSGYDLDVIGSGQFRASASSTSSSLARSVAGRAGA